ncbi:MAG: DUF1330 domain-containing protein [Pseudomonadota bacterium]
MKHYSVLEVTPRDDSWVQAYLPIANQLLRKHGGRYLARTTQHENIEGELSDVGLRIIIEWPSREAALAFEHDEEYRPHLEARLANSASSHVLIAGQDDLA